MADRILNNIREGQPLSGEREEGQDSGSVVQEYATNGRVSAVLDLHSPESARRLIGSYPELAWLTGDVNATPEGLASASQGALLSEQVFNQKHIEFDRTAVGIMVLKWVLTGDYDGFTACQPDGAKLSPERFADLHKYVRTVLPDQESIDAMVTYMVINDLGKIKSVVAQVQSRLQVEDVDHDKILLAALERAPDIAPSFQRLTTGHKDLIINGLKAEFNIGQFLQGENVAASLNGLTDLDRKSLDFYLLHAMCDIAGAAGQVKQNGSLVMTEPTYYGFTLAIKAIEKMAAGSSAKEVYDDYLSQRAKTLELDISMPKEKALTRICCMLRVSDSKRAAQVQKAFDSLPENTRALLEQELNRSGVDDGFATLVYYAPAILANAQAAHAKAAGSSDAFESALHEGLTAIARIYSEAASALKERVGNGVFTVMAASAAEAAKVPGELGQLEFDLRPVALDAELVTQKKKLINARRFPDLQSLADLPGARVAVVGIGGGSDGIQAAQLAGLLRSSGKTCDWVISVRTAKTTSQNAAGKVGEDRTVQDHGGEIVPGVYRILENTRGSGRFLENIPADEQEVFLVVDHQDGNVHLQIREVLQHVGGVDTVIAVDTGGDALYSISGQDQARATPDQDLRILKALQEVGVKVHTCEVACGVDSPADAEEVLLRANARYYRPTPGERESILMRYRRWKMDGTDPDRFGKTPLAWQFALEGRSGYQCLPLPTRVVLDRANPWNPFVPVDGSVSESHEGAMSGMFLMTLEDHLRAIEKQQP